MHKSKHVFTKKFMFQTFIFAAFAKSVKLSICHTVTKKQNMSNKTKLFTISTWLLETANVQSNANWGTLGKTNEKGRAERERESCWGPGGGSRTPPAAASSFSSASIHSVIQSYMLQQLST